MMKIKFNKHVLDEHICLILSDELKVDLYLVNNCLDLFNLPTLKQYVLRLIHEKH